MEITEQTISDMKKVHEEIERTIPNGYIKVELSSHGMLGAPAKFHIRNFLTEDMMGLVTADDEDFEIKLCQMLQDLILEEDCDIKKFHEKEVVETLLILYRSFYQTTLHNLTWILTDEDKERIAQVDGGKTSSKYKEHIAAIERGEEKKQFDLNLNFVNFYELNDDFKSTIKVKKPNGFECEYTFPRYGDKILLKEFLMSLPFFKKGEKRFAAVRENLKFTQQKRQEWDEGKDIDLNRIPKYPEEEIKEFKEYETEKMQFATRAVKALHLKSIDGKDISALPLEERMKIAEDPRLDHATFEKISKMYEELKVGPNENIKVMDPYLGHEVTIKYPFRVPTLVQAIRDSDIDGTVIEFV